MTMNIKLIEYGGHEQIHAVESVWAHDAPEHGTDAKKVWATPLGGGDPLQFSQHGIVYVMNQNGATIAKYWLGHNAAKNEPGDKAK